MKYAIMVCLLLSFSACSAKKFVAGEVAHRVAACTNTNDCKAQMNKDCPDGGVLHRVSPSIMVEYSCR